MNGQLQAAFEFLMPNLLRASWQACVLAAVVVLAHWALGSRLSGRARYALWGLVILRLLLPVVPQSPLSLFNLMTWSSQSEIPTPDSRAKVVFVTPTVGEVEPKAVEKFNASSTVSATRPSSPSLLSWLGIIWLAGAVALSLRVGWVCMTLSKLLRRLNQVTHPRLMQIVQESSTSLRLRRRPHVLVGESIRTPAVVGVFRPTLILPSRVLHEFDPAELRLIVLHELAHLKRHD